MATSGFFKFFVLFGILLIFMNFCLIRACYEDGKLKSAPKPIACNQGTTITIEELFHNMPQRRQALKSAAEEYQRISDVVSKYAVHNAHVSFMLKKFGEQPSLKTNLGASREQHIANVFGAQISKELLSLQLNDSVHKFQMHGLISKVNYSAKKGIMLLFINHRLVDSAGIYFIFI